MTRSSADEPRSHLAPGTSFEDFSRARSAFFETLRHDSEFRRIVAAWDRPAGDAPTGDGRPAGADGPPAG